MCSLYVLSGSIAAWNPPRSNLCFPYVAQSSEDCIENRAFFHLQTKALSPNGKGFEGLRSMLTAFEERLARGEARIQALCGEVAEEKKRMQALCGEVAEAKKGRDESKDFSSFCHTISRIVMQLRMHHESI